MYATGPAISRQNLGIGAGSSDSCAACHGSPRGSAGFGGDVVTRPDSRDAPHLFGLGLKEMLADEITAELRQRRDQAIAQARLAGSPVTRSLLSKGISYGVITAMPDGKVECLARARASTRICAFDRSSRTAAQCRSASSSSAL